MGTATKVVDREYLRSQFKNFNDILVKPKIQDLENRKVDKVAGKGLSSNDFTDALKTKLEGLSNYDDTALVNAINTLNGDINTSGSVAKTTADAVAAIVAGADASFDTLKEISDWISSHADSAAAMNSAIQDNTAAIALLNGNENTSGSVAHSIKEAFDALAYEIEDTDIDFANLDKIIISGPEETIGNETIQLTSSVSGVTWSSSDPSIATVDENGVVTPLETNTGVRITASKEGYTSGTKNIMFWVGRTTISGPSTVKVGEQITLTANNGDMINPTIQGSSHITYVVASSGDPEYPNNQMVITGVEPGTVTITTIGGNAAGYTRSEPFELTVIPADTE